MRTGRGVGRGYWLVADFTREQCAFNKVDRGQSSCAQSIEEWRKRKEEDTRGEETGVRDDKRRAGGERSNESWVKQPIILYTTRKYSKSLIQLMTGIVLYFLSIPLPLCFTRDLPPCDLTLRYPSSSSSYNSLLLCLILSYLIMSHLVSSRLVLFLFYFLKFCRYCLCRKLIFK